MRKFIISLFFISLIASTLVGFVFKDGDFFRERLFLPHPPVFTTASLMDDRFYKSLEAYLNSRNPLRAQYIKSKSWFDVSIFKTSSTDKIHMGRDGWLYYRPATKSLFKADCKKKEEALKLAKDIQRLEGGLKKSGKQFIFIVAPDKVTIYPEYFGGVWEANECGKNFYDLFLEALERYPVRGFLRLDKKFMEAKKTDLLYYSGGTHWNDRGAALAGELLLKKLSTPELSYHLPEIDFSKKRVLSELSRMLFVDLYELAPIAESIRFETDVKTNNIDPMPFIPYEWTKIRTTAHCPSCRPLLPKAIIYRDSFMTSTLKFIKGSFKEIFVRWSYIVPEDTRSGTRELATANIVIIEIAQRDLEKLKIQPGLALKQVRAIRGTTKENLL